MGRRTLLLIASILVAATGTALVWLYVQGAESRARAGQALVPVYVALDDISAGARRQDLTSDKVGRKLVPASAAPENRLQSLDAVGTYTTTQLIFAGQVLITPQFGDPATSAGVPDDRMAMEVDLADPNRVAGLLRPESQVAIYYVPNDTADAKAAGGGMVKMLLDKVRVIAVGNATTALTTKGTPAKVGTETGVSSAIVSLDVKGPEATLLMLAQTRGQLYFTLLGKNAKGQPSDGVTVAQLLAR